MKARSRAHLARNPLFVRCGDPAKLCDHIQPTPPDDREGVLRGPIQSMCPPRQARTQTPATNLYEELTAQLGGPGGVAVGALSCLYARSAAS